MYAIKDKETGMFFGGFNGLVAKWVANTSSALMSSNISIAKAQAILLNNSISSVQQKPVKVK